MSMALQSRALARLLDHGTGLETRPHESLGEAVLCPVSSNIVITLDRIFETTPLDIRSA